MKSPLPNNPLVVLSRRRLTAPLARPSPGSALGRPPGDGCADTAQQPQFKFLPFPDRPIYTSVASAQVTAVRRVI